MRNRPANFKLPSKCSLRSKTWPSEQWPWVFEEKIYHVRHLLESEVMLFPHCAGAEMNTSLHLRPKRKTQTPSGLLSLNKHPRLCRGVAADAKPAGTSAFPGRHGSPPTVSTLKPSAGSARHVRPTVAIAEGGPAASPRWTPRRPPRLGDNALPASGAPWTLKDEAGMNHMTQAVPLLRRDSGAAP